MNNLMLLVGFVVVIGLAQAAGAGTETSDGEKAGYNPLAIETGREAVKVIDLAVQDAAREREIPLRVYLPVEAEARPVVLFSHGLGGSCKGNAFMGEHWAGRGYVAVFMQHPGSDTSVWEGKPAAERMKAMKKAGNAKNFKLRVEDVPAVLDALEGWNKAEGHALEGRVDMARVCMSGHSFGAVTTQAVSGQTFGRGKKSLTDPRIKAAIAFSQSSPRQGGDPKKAFGEVKVPWMLMTGTKDVTPAFNMTLESRLAVYPALPPVGKYEVVLYEAEHSAFTDRALPGDREERNPNHHRAILALSTAFLDAWVCGDAEAKAWLDGDGTRGVLQEKDRWQRK